MITNIIFIERLLKKLFANVFLSFYYYIMKNIEMTLSVFLVKFIDIYKQTN